jgi:hypothetical protein
MQATQAHRHTDTDTQNRTQKQTQLSSLFLGKSTKPWLDKSTKPWLCREIEPHRSRSRQRQEANGEGGGANQAIIQVSITRTSFIEYEYQSYNYSLNQSQSSKYHVTGTQLRYVQLLACINLFLTPAEHTWKVVKSSSHSCVFIVRSPAFEPSSDSSGVQLESRPSISNRTVLGMMTTGIINARRDTVMGE